MTEASPKPQPRPPAVESKPIIGGRLWVAILVFVGLGIIANPRFNQLISQRYAPEDRYTNTSRWKVGNLGELSVTVITADAGRLACSSDVRVDGAHCQYGADGRPTPREPGAPLDDNNANVIQPYRTSPDNRLILLVGLWSLPEPAMRLHREPPSTVPVKRLQRFDVKCKVKFVGEFDTIKLRWETGTAWQNEARAMVARPLACTVVGSSS